MDPNATIKWIFAGFVDLIEDPADQDRRDEVADMLRDLAGWIANGGAAPTPPSYLIERHLKK